MKRTFSLLHTARTWEKQEEEEEARKRAPKILEKVFCWCDQWLNLITVTLAT